MKEIAPIIVRLKQKADALHMQVVQLSIENEELINEVLALKEDQEQAEKRIKELENKTINLQFSNTLQVEEKGKLKQTINELITEIDKGLELLKG